MDIKNLETASDYINNLLLSRGLLRNGEPICFAHPSQDEGGKQATITKVINLVHDLILRRDRESEIMVKLSQDVVNLRNTSSQHTQTIQKLESHNAEIGRQLALKSASEKTATMALKSAEARTKVLKEDMSRLKATVGQIRAQCANDVRKKEVELRRLQKYLELKRGREGSVQVGVAVVNPGTTLLGSSSNQAYKQTSLFQETIDHLTHVSRELSTENQVLRMLVQSTISTLQDLQGIPSVSAADEGTSDDMVSQFNVVPCTVFEANITEILTQLRSLLTNPSFVSLEEVHVREEEIVRLREGWEKMEARWREALSLMHSWRKRMMETGDAINLDDLRKGLVLGSTPITLPPTSVRKGRVSIGQMPSPDNSTVEDQSAATSLDQQEMGSATMSLDRWTNSKSLASSDQQEESPQRRSGNNTSPVIECSNQRQEVGIFPAPRILHPTTGNSRGLPRPLQMHPKRYSNDLDVLHKPSNKSPHKRHRSSQTISEPDIDDFLAEYDDDDDDNPPNDPEEEDQQDLLPLLTIEQKLSHAKQEAEQAASALRKAMSSSSSSAAAVNPPHPESKTEKATIKRTKAPPLRLRANGAATAAVKRSKRRSTLLPEELEGLIGGAA